jgi:plastocyanin
MTLAVTFAVTSALVGAACGGSAPSGPDAGTGTGGNPPAATVVTITSLGASPQSLTVTKGAQVTFINNDTITHLMYSDPHPDHTDCPDLNQVGALDRGQSRQTGNLNTARTCGFHDHNQPLNAALRGTIVIR